MVKKNNPAHPYKTFILNLCLFHLFTGSNYEILFGEMGVRENYLIHTLQIKERLRLFHVK